MRHLLSALALALALLPATAAAQVDGTVVGRTVPDSVYELAQRLVVGGNGADGRAIIDSLLRAARPGSPDYAEALYWHAALAETAADAERGYLRLSIEYPLSPRTEEALVRLGQLELTRGNRGLALRRFERATREFPDSPQRARTELMIARIYLDGRQYAQGCAAVEQGQLAANPQDVELRNQLDYLGRRCASLAASGALARVTPRDSALSDGATGDTAVAVAADSVPSTAPAASDTAAAPSTPRAAGRDAARDGGRAGRAGRGSRGARPARPSMTPRDADVPPELPAAVDAATSAAEAVSAEPAPATPRAPGFSVQVAAFDRTEPARALAEKLRKEGWDARVDTDAKWQRVRVGYFATRAEAAELARRLMAKGVNGFVTGVGGR
ncbi:MAG TPA: SPOR domain-containing protein [Gemmatimonadaceae bacterium]|nr:SPOR domain-containing protein [Gemmatimonadaceae bacterium]